MYTVNMASIRTHEEGWFVFLDDLDNVNIYFIRQNNDLEEEIAHLLNEINIFIFKLKKKTQPIRL